MISHCRKCGEVLCICRTPKARSELSGGLGGACDHTIGVEIDDAGGFLLASDFAIRAKQIRERYEEWKRNPHASPGVIAAKDKYSDRQFIGEVYCMFRFCPYCGAELETYERK